MVEVHPDSFLKPVGSRFSKGRHTCIDCECTICKSVKAVDTSLLKNGVINSCGCLKYLKPKKDRTGYVTDSGVVVVGYVSDSNWRFLYTCGHTSDGKIGQALNNSTGLCNSCSKSKTTIDRNTKHNMTRTPTYHSWLAMRRRCNDPSNNRYDSYGGRGIKVCKEWDNSFENFLRDMGEKPKGCSIERLDTDGWYTKDNCVWATDITQANNKSNVMLITNGVESWSLMRWCDILGIDYKNAWYRIKNKQENIASVLGESYSYV